MKYFFLKTHLESRYNSEQKVNNTGLNPAGREAYSSAWSLLVQEESHAISSKEL